MTRYAIDTCALLVEANISVYTGRRLDKSVTDEVNVDKKASKGAARVTKNLFADRPELEAINKHVGACRTYLYTHTLPWSDSGLRLLPTAEFFKFNERMALFEEEFEAMVKAFIEVYPSLITAQAMALGDLFNRDDYPSPDSMHRKFSFHVGYLPVPAAGDFRIDVGNEAQEELKRALEAQSATRLHTAVAELKGRLGEHLERMADRLGDQVVNGELKAQRFHASLIDGAKDLCVLVKNLNVTGDAGLEEARGKLETALDGISAEDLREDHVLRAVVRGQVEAILRVFVWKE